MMKMKVVGGRFPVPQSSVGGGQIRVIFYMLSSNLISLPLDRLIDDMVDLLFLADHSIPP